MPRLHGGWLQDHRLWYVAVGENFGLGKGTHRGRPTEPRRASAREEPDRRRAGAGLLPVLRRPRLLPDRLHREPVRAKVATVSLIDALPALGGPMVARGVPRVALIPWNKKTVRGGRHGGLGGGLALPNEGAQSTATARRRTRCRGGRRAPPRLFQGRVVPIARVGAVRRGSPRRRGVFDVASKAPAMPYVHRAARGDDKRRLEALDGAHARARAARSAANFTEALDYRDEAPPEEGGVARRVIARGRQRIDEGASVANGRA